MCYSPTSHPNIVGFVLDTSWNKATVIIQHSQVCVWGGEGRWVAWWVFVSRSQKWSILNLLFSQISILIKINDHLQAKLIKERQVHLNEPKYLNWKVCANIVDQGYTVCHSVSIFWKHYCTVNPQCSNFRILSSTQTFQLHMVYYTLNCITCNVHESLKSWATLSVYTGGRNCFRNTTARQW